MSTPTSFELLRLPEQSARLHIPERTLREWVARRIIPVYRPTKRMLLFNPVEVEQALKRFRSEGRP